MLLAAVTTVRQNAYYGLSTVMTAQLIYKHLVKKNF